MTMNAEAYQAAGSVSLEKVNAALFPKIRDPKAIDTLIDRTQSWTAGHRFLTRLIYQYIRQYSAQIIRTEGASNIVDEIVHHKILKNWRHNEAANLLSQIEQTLHQFEYQDTLIVLYLQILWREGIVASSQPKLTAEKDTLIRSGLVALTQGQLQLSNRIYASVFNRQWIEQQLPGLTTRTVSTDTLAQPSHPENKQNISPTPRTETLTDPKGNYPPPLSRQSTLRLKVVKPLSTAAFIVSGIAIFGISTMAYFKAPNNLSAIAQSIAKNTQPQNNTLQNSTQQPPDSSASTANSAKASFDQGLVHATNGRWLPTIQQFCNIPPTSVYFNPAKSHIERWITLYPQEIQQANNTLLTKQNTPCDLIESALKSVK